VFNLLWREFFFKVPKNRKNKFQKPYLEDSNSIRSGVRAFFRFHPEQKNQEFFQMSQNARLKILRCVVLSKVFSKKRNSLARKNLIALVAQKTICNGSAAQLAPRHRWPGLPKPLPAQLACSCQLIFSNVLA
jgi:hypothetical protein